jgi:hypothetical protein
MNRNRHPLMHPRTLAVSALILFAALLLALPVVAGHHPGPAARDVCARPAAARR